MKRDRIADGEALPEDNTIPPLRDAEIISLQDEPQQSAFRAYRQAFGANAADPCLRNAVALVRAWNALADAVGLERR